MITNPTAPAIPDIASLLEGINRASDTWSGAIDFYIRKEDGKQFAFRYNGQ